MYRVEKCVFIIERSLNVTKACRSFFVFPEFVYNTDTSVIYHSQLHIPVLNKHAPFLTIYDYLLTTRHIEKYICL
jgi:hypothetical protein